MANANSASSSTDSLYRSRHPVFSQVLDSFNFDGSTGGSVRVDGVIEHGSDPPGHLRVPPIGRKLLTELEDVYLLASQPEAVELRNSDEIQAQIELATINLVARAFATDFINNMEITESDIQAEYDQQASLSPTLQYKARHILVESQGEAVEIIGELDQGADFATLAQEKSTGPSGPNGGDLGWFSPEQMVAPFSEAVAALEDGSYSESPVQTQFGWHVILREETRDTPPPPLESVRDQVRNAIQQKRFQALLEQIRFEASE